MCCNSYQKPIDVKVFLSCDDKKPQPGDLIEISRGLYAHWAVYVGDGFVVHFGVPGKSFTQLTHLTPPCNLSDSLYMACSFQTVASCLVQTS